VHPIPQGCRGRKSKRGPVKLLSEKKSAGRRYFGGQPEESLCLGGRDHSFIYVGGGVGYGGGRKSGYSEADSMSSKIASGLLRKRHRYVRGCRSIHYRRRGESEDVVSRKTPPGPGQSNLKERSRGGMPGSRQGGRPERGLPSKILEEKNFTEKGGEGKPED